MLRFYGSVCLALCVMFLCACGEGVRPLATSATLSQRPYGRTGESPGYSKGGETNKAAETHTPQASLRAPATPIARPLTPDPIIEKAPVETLPVVNVPDTLQDVVDQAVQDLAERLDVGVEQIDVVELRSVVWSDGALGCPQPGMAYIQVQQEGLFMRLRVGKRVYNYHSGGGSAPFFCEKSARVGEDLAPSPGLGNE